MDASFQSLLVQEKLTYPEALARLYPGEWPEVNLPAQTSDMLVGVVGHPYCLYDDYVSHNLIARLRQLGVGVLTSEMVSAQDAQAGIARTTGQTRWFYESWMSGAGGHYLQRPDVHGVVSVLAFTCGPDFGHG